MIDKLEDDRPPDDALFRADDVPGVPDGDWPGFPNQEMLRILPERVIALGEVDDSIFNGSRLDLPVW